MAVATTLDLTLMNHLLDRVPAPLAEETMIEHENLSCSIMASVDMATDNAIVY